METHTGHQVRHVRCGRPLRYRAFRDGPTHALTATSDRMTFTATCGEIVRMGSGETPNVLPVTDRGAEKVTCEACRLTPANGHKARREMMNSERWAWKVEVMGSGGWCSGGVYESRSAALAAAHKDYPPEQNRTRLTRVAVPEGAVIYNEAFMRLDDLQRLAEKYS